MADVTSLAPDQELLEDRLLVLAPTAEDAALSDNIIGGAGMACTNCADVHELAREIERGAAAILLTEGILAAGDPDRLVQAIRGQPGWSDIPVLLLAGGGADAPAAVWLMEALGNVTVLDRPVRIITLISALRSALKARHRQYQVRDQLLTIGRAQASLEEEAQRKDEFLATLAHELRNPLAPISNSLHLLQHSETQPGQAKAAVEMMTRQVAHMVRLVDDLLDVSRITRGNVELRHEDVDIAAAVNAAVDAARPLIQANRHHLRVEIDSDVTTIDADAVRLTQILTNLLNNAAKYTSPDGFIGLRCRLAHPVGGPPQLEVRITDSGAGIPPHMLNRVFDMFTQVDHTRAQAHGGLGIGLTLVRSLVELHGGSVEARSQGLGHGSEFVVRLPLRRSRSPNAGPKRSDGVENGATLRDRRVLIVDDNRDAADSLAEVLRRRQARIEVAYDGVAALSLMEQFHPHAVVLDLGMPGVDGYELARRIRNLPEGDEIRLVAQTGWGQDRERRLSEEAGIDHHLVKPVDLTVLEFLLSG